MVSSASYGLLASLHCSAPAVASKPCSRCRADCPRAMPAASRADRPPGAAAASPQQCSDATAASSSRARAGRHPMAPAGTGAAGRGSRRTSAWASPGPAKPHKLVISKAGAHSKGTGQTGAPPTCPAIDLGAFCVGNRLTGSRQESCSVQNPARSKRVDERGSRPQTRASLRRGEVFRDFFRNVCCQLGLCSKQTGEHEQGRG